MPDYAAYWIVALFAAGMAVIFFFTDRRSPTSRAIALCLASMGLAIPENILVWFGTAAIPDWMRLFARVPFEALAMIAGLEWGLRVARTAARDTQAPVRNSGLVRVSQLLVIFYAVMSAARPDLRARAFLAQLDGDLSMGPLFYVYAAPLLLAGTLIVVAGVLLLRRGPDASERARVIGMLAAMPWLASGLILSREFGAVAMSIGLLLFLGSAMRYHVLQARQSAFVSQFLSPQIERLVRERGLSNAMQTQRLPLTVLCCDLRGFTAYATATAPERVMQVLRDYYHEVGEVVALNGGTIKDQAGDGVLVLFGAPLPEPRHADEAVACALAVRERLRPLAARWAEGGSPLGLGIGIASGEVAVGVIGDATRLEYTAVGPAVNLAARLCARAADGEIRCDAGTLALCSTPPPARHTEPLQLKGFAAPVHSLIL